MKNLKLSPIKLTNVLLIICGFVQMAFAKEDIKPSIEPAIFSYSTEITVTYDVTDNVLANLDQAYIWVWIPGQNIDAKYNLNPASDDPGITDNAKFSKATDNGETTFSITFTPADFFDGDISAQTEIGMLLKGNDWGDGQTEDFVTELADDTFSARLLAPTIVPVFVDTNEALEIEATATASANYNLTINGSLVNTQNGVVDYNYSHMVSETEGLVNCELQVSDPVSLVDTTISFDYIIRTSTVESPRPAGIIPGITYDQNDNTKATLCLQAPMKTSVFVLGEFNNFTVSPDFQMIRDGEYFWLEITSLTAGQEYAFQYLVDETVYVADPYADKILDPDDQWIPETIYPDLKNYPEESLRSEWYFNRLSIIETDQTEYEWKNDAYSRPEKDDLIIYELLVRDFFDENNRSYNNLIDTITYFKNLGINAIELMPVQEFNGNSSWGYNPTFMFAPDKAYGTKDKLKEFIDVAHEHGIAVIMDVVFNHQDVPNPMAAMYFDFDGSNFKPTADNPWFNVEATHPFSVFFDMNHESDYTKQFMDTTLHYWINEYHVDGFRFDLSKGFTQTQSGSDVGKWSQRDQSRIDIIKRMADEVWSYSQDTWLMLEHFADNSEETELADYGLLVWGNMHGAYIETVLGYHENGKSNLEWGYAPERGWQELNLITYMESHDEERQMYDALQFGNSEGDYTVKDKNTALDRVKGASAFLYTVPGPKMFWQFGELGYDISIEENGRTGEKPVKWEYYDDPDRKKLHDLKKELIKFRLENDIFKDGTFTWSPENEVKRIAMGDDNMKMLIIGNFGVISRMVPANFPEPGTWYDFFTGDSFDISDTGMEMLFEPGEFHLYTTQKIEGVTPDLVPWGSNFIITSLEEELPTRVTLYPNPSRDLVQIDGIKPGLYDLDLTNTEGKILRHELIPVDQSLEFSISQLEAGIYFLKVSNANDVFHFKMIKK